MKNLNLTQLKAFKPDAIIAHGEARNEPHGLYMSSEPSYQGRELIWIAVKHDNDRWACYTSWADKSLLEVLKSGDKVTSENHIKRLINVDQDCMEHYNF